MKNDSKNKVENTDSSNEKLLLYGVSGLLPLNWYELQIQELDELKDKIQKQIDESKGNNH